MALETFVDVIVEYFKQSSLSPFDATAISSMMIFTLPLLVGAIRSWDYSKWKASLYLIATSVAVLTPVLYMKIQNIHNPLIAFFSYSLAALLLLLVLIDLIFFVLLKLVDLIFFVLEKLLRDKTNK